MQPFLHFIRWRFLAAGMLFFALACSVSPGAAAQDVASKFAQANGVRLHYLTAGKGEPIVLLHGYAETSHMWLPLIRQLARTNLVIAPDLRGAGSSDAPDTGYAKADLARVLAGEKASGEALITQGKLVAGNVQASSSRGRGTG